MVPPKPLPKRSATKARRRPSKNSALLLSRTFEAPKRNSSKTLARQGTPEGLQELRNLATSHVGSARMWLSHALAEQHTPEAMQELRILATTGFIGDPAPTVGDTIGPWMTFIQTLVDQGTSEALQELRDLAQQISAEAEERLARSESHGQEAPTFTRAGAQDIDRDFAKRIMDALARQSARPRRQGRRAAQEAAVAALVEAGVTVIDRPGYDDKTIKELREIRLLKRNGDPKVQPAHRGRARHLPRTRRLRHHLLQRHPLTRE